MQKLGNEELHEKQTNIALLQKKKKERKVHWRRHVRGKLGFCGSLNSHTHTHRHTHTHLLYCTVSQKTPHFFWTTFISANVSHHINTLNRKTHENNNNKTFKRGGKMTWNCSHIDDKLQVKTLGMLLTVHSLKIYSQHHTKWENSRST